MSDNSKVSWNNNGSIVERQFTKQSIKQLSTASDSMLQLAVNLILQGINGLPPELAAATTADIGVLRSTEKAGNQGSALVGSLVAKQIRAIVLYCEREKVSDLLKLWNSRSVERRTEPNLSAIVKLCTPKTSRNASSAETDRQRAVRYFERIIALEKILKDSGIAIPENPQRVADTMWYAKLAAK